MTAEIKIRDLMQKDWEDWHRLWLQYLDFFETSPRDIPTNQLFKSLLAPTPHSFHCVVGEFEGNVQGFAHFIFHDQCGKPQQATYLEDLFVDPSTRGLGLARTIIEGVYTRADAANAPCVYWITHKDNLTAQRLYDRIAKKRDSIRYERIL